MKQVRFFETRPKTNKTRLDDQLIAYGKSLGKEIKEKRWPPLSPTDELQVKLPGDDSKKETWLERFQRFLVSFNHHDEFYILTNLKKNEITWSHGIHTWAGYKDIGDENEKGGKITSFQRDFITEYVPGFIREWYKMFTDAAMLALAETKQPTHSLTTRFVINFPLRDINGHYVLVRQITMPFEYDENDNIVSFISSYFIVGDYLNEPLDLEFYESNKKFDASIHRDVSNKLIECSNKLKKTKNFTEVHLKIIEAIRSLIVQEVDITIKGITDYVMGTYKNEMTDKTCQRYLNTIKNRLKWIFQPGADKTELAITKQFLQFNKKALAFITFLERSGINHLLKANLDKLPEESVDHNQ